MIKTLISTLLALLSFYASAETLEYEGRKLKRIIHSSILDDYSERTGLDLRIPRESATPQPLSERKKTGSSNRGYFVPFELESEDAIKIAGASTVAVIFFANDAEISQFLQDNQSQMIKGMAKAGEAIGSEGGIAIAGAGYIIGVIAQNSEIKRVSVMAAKAMFVSGLATAVLKRAFDRQRPGDLEDPYNFDHSKSGAEYASFPSGHTTTAFALATVIAEKGKKYNRYIPLLAYSVAALAGWSRVHDDAHWPSDVVIGGLVGHLIAKHIVRSPFYEKGFLIVPEFSRREGIKINVIYTKKPRSTPCDRPHDISYCFDRVLSGN